jgi:HAD superfamily hydrolase (TIGR01509 family)
MPPRPAVVQAVVFDMDGVLIDSEPFWREAEIETFGRCGLRLTDADCVRTTGMRIQDVARYWFERSPWNGPDPDAVAEDILLGVIRRVGERGSAMPGVGPVIARCRTRGLRLALATSSAVRLIDAVLVRLDLRNSFEVICSAENGMRGKPHPDVYLCAAAKLGLPPGACLAVEDSIAGVEAAKAAGMTCIAVPLPELRDDPRYRAADVVIESLLELDDSLLNGLLE